MTRVENVAVAAQSTFGRDGAMFEGLLGFVAQLSVGLWSLVVLTAGVRFIGMRIYRRAAARRALFETQTETPTETAQSASIPGAVAAAVPLDPPRHAAPVSSAPVTPARRPVLAPDPVEA